MIAKNDIMPFYTRPFLAEHAHCAQHAARISRMFFADFPLQNWDDSPNGDGGITVHIEHYDNFMNIKWNPEIQTQRSKIRAYLSKVV